MIQAGAYLISREQMLELEKVVLVDGKNGKKTINKKWVGRDAKLILKQIEMCIRGSFATCPLRSVRSLSPLPAV